MDSRQRKYKIIAMLEKHDRKLIKYYIEKGPDKLRETLEIESESLWKIVFDFLVFEREAVQKLIKRNTLFVSEIFVENGPDFLKRSFKLDKKGYAGIWEFVMDYIGIANGSIFDYVNSQTAHFQKMIVNGKATQIRMDLCLDKPKYDKIWEEILDILLECISFSNFTYAKYEQGLRFFTNMYNNGRTHRSVKKCNEIGYISD